MASESFVYLEDIETKKTPKPVEASGSENAIGDTAADAANGKVSKPAGSSQSEETGKKRQRDITEMFMSQPKEKKLKGASSAPAKSGSLRLNAIPFSLVQFQESLTEDQRGLLALECTNMGKSWCVP